jgi:hypothetical protein
MKNLKGLSVEKIEFEGSAIFYADEWECKLYADELPDYHELRITVEKDDLYRHSEDSKEKTEYFLENCEEREFRYEVERVAKVMITEIFRDGNIEFQIYEEEKTLNEMFKNLHN